VRLVIILSAALCVLGIVENILHQRNLRKIPVRILVNGTRGKSSVTRLIAGALREAGYRTIAKTTGSEARIIIEDGTEIPVLRPLGPRIIEQKALARLAVRHHANALVVECMAIRPESQMVMQRQLVRATIGVITNVRVDHIEEMGPTLNDTASALSFSIPSEGTLVTSDSRFAGAAGRVVVVDPSQVGSETLSRFSYPVFAENVSLALQVAAELGISRETALQGMTGARPDLGVLKLFKVESPLFKAVFINGFAANDVESTVLVWEEASAIVPADLPVIMLYNNRMDREYRIAEFLKLPQKIKKPCLVAVVGEHQDKVAKLFSKQGLETLAFKSGTTSEELLAAFGAKIGAAFLLFGVGNIYGIGKDLVAYCAEHGSAIDWRREGKCFRNR
jgi:gamma-polyglutamate synthase